MAGKKKTPSEFPTDWHYEQHLADLKRELAGRENRLAELEATTGADEWALEQAQGEVDAVKAQLAHYTKGQRSASKRPAGAKAESRG